MSDETKPYDRVGDDAQPSSKRGTDEKSIKLHEYLVAHSYKPNKFLDGLQKASLEHSKSDMVSPPDSIPILTLLVELIKARTIIEVGVFTGYATLGMAQALPQDGLIYALDHSEEYVDIGKPFWKEAGVDKKVMLMIGKAADSLEQLVESLPPNSVDLAFIDADKNNYVIYYEHLLKLVRPGGIIVVDNVLWYGTVINPKDNSSETKGIRAINDKLYNDDRVTIAMLKNSDGITIAVKK